MRIHREPAAYSENRLGDRLGCAGAACLSARNYLLSFFLSGFSPPRFATRSATVVLLFCCHPPSPFSLFPAAETARTPPSSRSPRFLLYPPLHPSRCVALACSSYASCSTGNEPPSSPGKEGNIALSSDQKRRTIDREAPSDVPSRVN